MSGRDHEAARRRLRCLIHSKLSFTFQRFRLFGIALKPCCGYSCFHPQEPPRGYVLRRIDVPVMHRPTTGTGPSPPLALPGHPYGGRTGLSARTR